MIAGSGRSCVDVLVARIVCWCSLIIGSERRGHGVARARRARHAFRARDPTLEALDWRGLRPGLDSLGVLDARTRSSPARAGCRRAKSRMRSGRHVPVLCLSVDPRRVRVRVRPARLRWLRTGSIVDRLPARHDRLRQATGRISGDWRRSARSTIRRGASPCSMLACTWRVSSARPFPCDVPMTVRGALTDRFPRR